MKSLYRIIFGFSLLIYSAVMERYMESNSFNETERACRAEGCVKRAVELTVFCLEHHIGSLQNAGALSKEPRGKWFPPYHRAGASVDS
jgi:hypothetical protein